jgi:hypothetical protein
MVSFSGSFNFGIDHMIMFAAEGRKYIFPGPLGSASTSRWSPGSNRAVMRPAPLTSSIAP